MYLYGDQKLICLHFLWKGALSTKEHRICSNKKSWLALWMTLQLHPKNTILNNLARTKCYHITLDPRLPFPDSVGGIFPGPASTKKVHQGIEWFSQLAGLQWLTVLSMLIRVITIAGDWPPYILLSCYVTLFCVRVKFDIFLSWECYDSPNLCFSS